MWLAVSVVATFALAAGKRTTGEWLGKPGPAYRGARHPHGRRTAAVLAGVMLNAAVDGGGQTPYPLW